MDYQGLKVLVVGGGKSGLAAAAKLLRMGAEVFLTDKQPKEKLKGLEDLPLDDTHLILEQSPDIREIKPDCWSFRRGFRPTSRLFRMLYIAAFRSGARWNLP